MKWTKQQSDAIEARGCSVIVSAAAGSGKTAVLTERIIRLIADPESKVRADRMIIVTFTNDAAAELKVRLNRKLRDLINLRPNDSYLLKQQILLQNAHISTINSFCFDMLRDNLTDEGVTSGFSIIDSGDNELLQAEALDETAAEFCENFPEDYSYLYDKFCVRDDSQLTEPLAAADRFLASVAFRDKWLDDAERFYSTELCDSPYFNIIEERFGASLHSALAAAEENLELAKEIFPDNSTKSAVYYIEQSQEEHRFVSAVCRLFDEKKLPVGEEFYGYKFTSLGSAKIKGVDDAKRERYKLNRERIKKPVNELIKSAPLFIDNYAESAKVTGILVRMLRRYYELLWEKKCEKNTLTFEDGERLTLNLLADFDENGILRQSEIARNCAEHYDIVLIDEYQDSNNKQDLIFKLISRNFKSDAYGNALYGDNVFLVGDVKQSIYGFRLANPKNFISTLQSSVPYSRDCGSPNQYIYLNQNFRSSPDVLDFVNYVFENLMTKRYSGIEYNEDERLYFGAQPYLQKPKGSFRTRFIFIDDDSDEDGDNADTSPNMEVRVTAAKIAQMLKEGAKTVTPTGIRPCRPSDFSILVRTNEQVSIYTAELERLGVPVRKAEEKGYLTSSEITTLLDILRIIDNPLLDYPMTAVLASPMYMFSINEIAQLKALDRDKALYVILRGVVGGDYPGLSDSAFIRRCADFLDALDDFRTASITMTLGELITKIYDTTDFISVMQLSGDGDKKRANLRALIQYAGSYEAFAASDGTPTLNGFLRHIGRININGAVKGKGSAASGDCVSVLTMHKSKGLEFPFVFIAETYGKSRSDSVTALCTDDGMIGYVLYDYENCCRYKTFQQQYIDEKKKQEGKNERLRLLYVGLTRAKQQLFINMKTGKNKLKRVVKLIENACVPENSLSEAASQTEYMSDHLWLSIIRHSKFAEIAEGITFDDTTLRQAVTLPEPTSDKDVFEYEFAEAGGAFDEFKREMRTKAAPDADICCSLRDIISFTYDTGLSKLPAKLSVTQLTQKISDDGESFDFSLKRPRFMSEAKGLTGTERGTAIHTFFQYCDFSRAADSAADEIERVTSLGYISPAQAESISIANTQAFFKSDIYARILAAKNVWREKKFMIAVADTNIESELMDKLRRSRGMIKGIIDLMLEEDDGLVIIDYKSDRGISAQALAERYKAQLKIYKAAAELTMGKKVKQLCLYSFELQRSVEIL